MIPFLLAAAGGYLIGSSLKSEKFASGGRIKVGTFDEAQLKNREDKKAVEKAMKDTGLKYVDTKIVKKGGKMYMDVFLIPDEEYYKSSKFADGGMMAKGGKTEDYYEDLRVYVQGVGEIYNGKSMKAAISAAEKHLKKHPKAEVAIVDEKYGDEYDLYGNLKENADGEEYAKGGITRKKLLDIQKEYDRNEDNNYHSENVVLLAKHFGTKEDLKEAKDILKQHEQDRQMTSENMKRRNKLDEKLQAAWKKERDKK